MVQINRGESSSFENPTLDVYLERSGIPFAPFTLEFEIWSTPDGGPDVQTYPVAGRAAVDLDADALEVGHYVADWLVPDDEALGPHEIRWFFVAEDGDPESSFTEDFSVGDAVAARADRLRGYCTVEDCRAEWLTVAMVSDARLREMIEEASRDLDSYCRWWFEPRMRTLRLDGTGTLRLYTPAPPLRIDSISVGDTTYDPADMILVEGGPMEGTRFEDAPGFRWDPEATDAQRWPKGEQNIVVTGVFGYTEADGSAFGRVPLPIKRACIMLVAGRRTPIATALAGGGGGGGGAGQLISIRTKTQSAAWAQRPASDAPFTGNAEVDLIIKRYRRSGIASV